ncbi:MAG: hypothetical protein H0S80_10620 [Desulfovibrionaceae bacterium]|nr:hypothetical protein [Desulfovibrionaceae bacterium]
MLIYLLIALGILALMLMGFLFFKPRKRNIQIQITIDFDAKKGDESHRQF